MQSLQPDQAEVLLHSVYLPALKNEHAITQRVIRAIPPDKGDYRPDNVSKSALELGWHIVATEMRFLSALPAGQFDFTPRTRPESIQTSADLLPWYAEHFGPLLDELPKLSNEQLVKVLDFRGLFQLPAVMFVNFVLSHTIHHRGQLTTYLRPMGAKVPPIYGESYDSAKAR